ncbi:hypothetical protein IF2G_00903 [Cordyceps javanica]|nr:hypothetical protein IF2G_00903 [Cordyceps javanica]
MPCRNNHLAGRGLGLIHSGVSVAIRQTTGWLGQSRKRTVQTRHEQNFMNALFVGDPASWGFRCAWAMYPRASRSKSTLFVISTVVTTQYDCMTL